MGTYVRLTGKIKLSSPVTQETLDVLNKSIGADGMFAVSKDASPSKSKGLKSKISAEVQVFAEMKNFFAQETYELIRDFFLAANKAGLLVDSGAIHGRSEYGEMWKVELSTKTVTLLEGEVIFKKSASCTLKVKEQINKVMIME